MERGNGKVSLGQTGRRRSNAGQAMRGQSHVYSAARCNVKAKPRDLWHSVVRRGQSQAKRGATVYGVGEVTLIAARKAGHGNGNAEPGNLT